MTTIEPRLIALLNNDTLSEAYNTGYPTSTPPSFELPPLHDPNILKASGRPLLLEPDAKQGGKSHLTALNSSIEEEKQQQNRNDRKKRQHHVSNRALGNSSPQSLRKILDNEAGNVHGVTSKKRNIIENGKDEFVQLPQPPKKHKAAKQVVPPIIIGLFEPPPQAALFPPIASSSFHDSHGRNSLNTVPPKNKDSRGTSNLPDAAMNSAKYRSKSKPKQKKDVKARRKWTEDETKNLLLGVHKHGVGKWTDILEDSGFAFNCRSAVDLKDRFRTCCPEELRRKSRKTSNSAISNETITKKSKSSLMSENILIEEDDSGTKETSSDAAVSSLRKSRAHRKKMEDLVELGIEGPFRKSQRRERKPFTELDDQEILSGYQLYGPAWTRIQRDSRFHLQGRQATDLRDRFRNKYPDRFRVEDASSKDSGKIDVREEPSTASSRTSTLQTSSSREGLKIRQILADDDSMASKTLPAQSNLPALSFRDFGPFSDPQTESTDSLPSFDWTSNAPFPENIGEMDISRLLLDETWIDNTRSKEKLPFTDINSLLSSTSDDLPQVPSYYGMLSDEQITLPSSAGLEHDAAFD